MGRERGWVAQRSTPLCAVLPQHSVFCIFIYTIWSVTVYCIESLWASHNGEAMSRCTTNKSNFEAANRLARKIYLLPSIECCILQVVILASPCSFLAEFEVVVIVSQPRANEKAVASPLSCVPSPTYILFRARLSLELICQSNLSTPVCRYVKSAISICHIKAATCLPWWLPRPCLAVHRSILVADCGLRPRHQEARNTSGTSTICDASGHALRE